MCGCTLYDSPTCGHSWISMSQPCGYLSDLLSCPYRQTFQTLIAPPYTCPQCNGAFADPETIEMVQGPWGCNQMIRNHVGGNYAVPGQWGSASLIRGGGWGGPAITSAAMSGAMIPMNHDFTYDHRLTGPYGPQAMVPHQAPVMGNGGMVVTNGPMISNGPMICDDGFGYHDDGFADGYDGHYNDRRKRWKHRSHYKYKYTDRPATNCTVM
jgi:hypothetical protein